MVCGTLIILQLDQTKSQMNVPTSSEQPIMQVHDDPISDPSVQLERAPSVAAPVKPLRLKLDIPDQAIREASRFVELTIDFDLPNYLVLRFLWLVIHRNAPSVSKNRRRVQEKAWEGRSCHVDANICKP